MATDVRVWWIRAGVTGGAGRTSSDRWLVALVITLLALLVQKYNSDGEGGTGRLDMDDGGFVVYVSTLSVAGERNRASVHELKNMLTDSMPAAESQLVVDRSFVLRHLGKGFGTEVLLPSARQLYTSSSMRTHT